MSSIRGFSLLEVLVALVVLSIGMMGIASMQVTGLQFNQQAMASSRATGLAADIADRIRANPNATVGAERGDAWEVDDALPAAAAPANCADTPDGDVTAVCTPQAMAAFDIWQWKTSLLPAAGSGLPDGRGAITHTFANGVATYLIDVSWDERGETARYQLTVEL